MKATSSTQAYYPQDCRTGIGDVRETVPGVGQVLDDDKYCRGVKGEKAVVRGTYRYRGPAIGDERVKGVDGQGTDLVSDGKGTDEYESD